MKTPADNPDNYSTSSVIPNVGNMNRPYLLIHGLSDDNVHMHHSTVLHSALITAGNTNPVFPLLAAGAHK